MKKILICTVANFESYLSQNHYADSTIDGYTRDVGEFFTWVESTLGKQVDPCHVNSDDIRVYQQYLQKAKEYKPITANRKMCAVSTFMNWARKEGVIDSNPVLVVSKLKIRARKFRFINREEQEALLQSLRRLLRIAELRYKKRWRTVQRNVALLLFILHTGLRLEEVCQVRLQDLELSESEGKVRVRGNKEREVPLNQKARQAIKSWLDVRPVFVGNDYLWVAVVHESNGALSGRSVQRIIRKLGQEAEIERLSVRMLRHTFAKNLVDHGVGIEKVAALLGLESLDFARLYVTSDAQDLKEAVESIG